MQDCFSMTPTVDFQLSELALFTSYVVLKTDGGGDVLFAFSILFYYHVIINALFLVT